MHFCVEHALPFPKPSNARSCPLRKDSKHEHWNKASCYQEKNKQGTMPSLVRRAILGLLIVSSLFEKVLFKGPKDVFILLLRTIHTLSSSDEKVPIETTCQHLCRCVEIDQQWSHVIQNSVLTASRNIVPMRDKEDSIDSLCILSVNGSNSHSFNVGCFLRVHDKPVVSNSELLQCHTFTSCMLCIVVPKFFIIQEVVSLTECYEVVKFGANPFTECIYPSWAESHSVSTLIVKKVRKTMHLKKQRGVVRRSWIVIKSPNPPTSPR